MAVQRPCGTVPLGTTNKDEVQESRLSRGGWQGGLRSGPASLVGLWPPGSEHNGKVLATPPCTSQGLNSPMNGWREE